MPASSESSPTGPAESGGLEALVARAGEIGIIETVNALIREALREGASTLHLEPRSDGGVARYRVAGELCQALTLPSELLLPVISRLKLMAGLDLSEHRAPQQGHIPIEHQGKPYDLPVATMPTLSGESLVMTIVDPAVAAAWTWERLGCGPVETMSALLSRPQGLLLFTGPPGSGKTTFLYSALNHLDAERLNIVTVAEDPAFHVDGVSHSRAGLPTRDAVRALMERDVDVIVIGEVREREEVEVALEAALAGHLVLTVLHASDVAHAIERLLALGVSPWQLSAGLSGVVASRLARRACPDCREAYQPDEESLRALRVAPEQAAAAVFYRGKGCDNCCGTGYRGRLGLTQILVVDAAVARLLADGEEGAKRRQGLRERLAQSGLRSFRDAAVEKALAGTMTVEEALRFGEE
jgi:type II secretory ATPase GspE/PulE/Tfp pilus assembly ATPase PilB-like protein